MTYDEITVVRTVGRITRTELHLCIEEGWVRPAEGEAGPVFDDLDVARLRLICDLRGDLALSDEALPVVLSLIDQLHGVRRELHDLARAVEQQPEHIRRAVIATRRACRDIEEQD